MAQHPEEPRPSTANRPNRTLSFRLEELVAVSAFLVSLASMAIAYQENRATKQLVQASSLPYLNFTLTFNRSVDHRTKRPLTASIVQTLENNGVGPADVRYAAMTFNGRKYQDAAKLLRDCCGVSQPHISAGLTDRMLRSGVAVNFLEVRGSDSAPGAIDRYALLLEAHKIRTIVCYCSVFSDCWTLGSLGSGRPQPVRECPTLPPNAQTL